MLNYTGTEFQGWLLWYSLPILKGILPEPYYTHYAGLVAGIGLLLQVPISSVNFQIAERLVHDFCRKITNLYGRLMHYLIHSMCMLMQEFSLLHLLHISFC